jgi:hypothetical protein
MPADGEVEESAISKIYNGGWAKSGKVYLKKKKK